MVKHIRKQLLNTARTILISKQELYLVCDVDSCCAILEKMIYESAVLSDIVKNVFYLS